MAAGGWPDFSITGRYVIAEEQVRSVCSLGEYFYGLGRVFLFFVSRLLGLVYAAGSKRKNEKKLNTRGCSFWGTTEHDRDTYTHATWACLRVFVCVYVCVCGGVWVWVWV